MEKKLLPIGSIVRIAEDSEVKFMIVGYFPENAQGERRDYSAIRYPMGVYDNRLYFFFNSSDIFQVVYNGYEDEEFLSMCSIIEDSNLWQGNKE